MRLSPEEKARRKAEREAVRAERIRQKEIEKEQQRIAEENAYKEKMLDGTARLMFNVFNTKSGNYSKEFEDLLMSGGGGNSLFVNCWTKPSWSFSKRRISKKALETLSSHGYATLDDAPGKFKYNNAKRAQNRKSKGKHLHLDHNPGNVKVLSLIRDECRKYDPDGEDFDYEDTIVKIKAFLSSVQTLDWITVDQDDIRTYGDDNHDKKTVEKMSHDERDALLNDEWEDL